MHILGGILKGHILKTPKHNKTRPTSSLLRKAIFDICQLHIQEATFLDLYAGTGAMGLEALSRGALSATFVENDKSAFSLLKQNIQNCQFASKTSVHCLDVLTYLKKLKDASFSLIYIDPPYDKHLVVDTLTLIDQKQLLEKNGLLFLETSRREDVESSHASLLLRKKRTFGDSVIWEFTSKES